MIRSTIYGPIQSRRLGRSLGINLMPEHVKVCSFDCLYCECGFLTGEKAAIPSRFFIVSELEKQLRLFSEKQETIDSFTFSGNGEATLHPDFEAIIDDTIRLRNQYFPSSRITVLSNSTRIFDSSVRRALQKVDEAVLKLDSAITSTMRLLDQPNDKSFSSEKIIEGLTMFREQIEKDGHGKLTIQTILLRGSYQEKTVDNTSAIEQKAWLKAIESIRPHSVMLYALDRPAPIETLEKVSMEEMILWKEKVSALGINVVVAG